MPAATKAHHGNGGADANAVAPQAQEPYTEVTGSEDASAVSPGARRTAQSVRGQTDCNQSGGQTDCNQSGGQTDCNQSGGIGGGKGGKSTQPNLNSRDVYAPAFASSQSWPKISTCEPSAVIDHPPPA